VFLAELLLRYRSHPRECSWLWRVSRSCSRGGVCCGSRAAPGTNPGGQT